MAPRVVKVKDVAAPAPIPVAAARAAPKKVSTRRTCKEYVDGLGKVSYLYTSVFL